MGKSTISMAIFNCYVSSPEGTTSTSKWLCPQNRHLKNCLGHPTSLPVAWAAKLQTSQEPPGPASGRGKAEQLLLCHVVCCSFSKLNQNQHLTWRSAWIWLSHMECILMTLVGFSYNTSYNLIFIFYVLIASSRIRETHDPGGHHQMRPRPEKNWPSIVPLAIDFAREPGTSSTKQP